MRLALLTFILLLSACTTIDKQIKDWPKLTIKKHEMTFFDLQGKCWKHMPVMYKLLGGFAFACAEVNLDAGTCDIYHLHSPSKTDIEHEESHCTGGDHDDILQKYFDGWKRSTL